MSTTLKSVSILTLLFLSISVQSQSLHHMQGEVLIQVSKNVQSDKILSLLRSTHGPDIDYQLEQVTSEPMNIWKVTTDYTSVSEYDLMRNLEGNSFFGACQLNHTVKKRVIPNDPEFEELYHFVNRGQNSGIIDADYDAEDAWDLTTGGTTVNGDEIVIAVIDDGLDGDHEDLVDNLWVNEAEIRDNGIDDDDNGFIDDYFGWDTDRNNPDIFDEGGHAVPLFGIIGAKGNNGTGVVGVNWDVKMMVIQGGGDEASTLAAYAYPYAFRKLYNETQGEEGAFVVATNSSFGIDNLFPEDTPLWCEFFETLGSVGIISCGATTNENADVDEVGDIPSTCRSDFFIGVTNLNNREEKVFEAGFGKESIDLAAFGEDIFTTSIQNRYATSSGTSEATPFVTGLVGLMYSLDCPFIADMSLSDPANAAMLIKKTLLNSVQKVPSLEDLVATGGRMNMNTSLRLLSEVCEACGTIISTSVDNRTDVMVDVRWDNGNGNSGANIRWRSEGSQNWSTQNGVSSPYTINGLSGCNNYEYQLQSVCNGNSSDWGPTFTFESEGCCVLPADVEFEIVGSTAQFTWTSIFAAREYLIESRPVGEAAWVREFVEDNDYSLVFQENCSAYDVRMKVICGGEETLFSEQMIVKNDCGACSSEDYCNINNIDNTFEWIDSVYFANDNFFSGRDDRAFASNTNIKSFTVTQGQETEVRVVPRFQSSSADENFAVFIDWNQNQRFDSDEEILSETSSTAVMNSITVPEDARLGPTRMRVIMAFSRVPTGCGATGFRFGEVEDYCVIVEEVPGECDVDSQLSINNVKNNRATLRWNTDENIISYVLRYKQAAASNWIELSEITDSLFISDLTKCTDYEAQIKNICSIDTSRYSSSIFFQTKCTDNTFEITPNFASIFPNPFSNNINIALKENLIDGSIELINIQGQILRSVDIDGSTNDYSFETSDLMSGVYLLRVANKTQAAFKKVIKLD